MKDLFGREVGIPRTSCVQDNGSDVREVGANGLYVPRRSVVTINLKTVIARLEAAAADPSQSDYQRATNQAHADRYKIIPNRKGNQ